MRSIRGSVACLLAAIVFVTWSPLRTASAQTPLCNGDFTCSWELDVGERAALLAYRDTAVKYKVCRTDEIRANAMDPGAVVGLILDGAPLIEATAFGTSNAARLTLVALQPKSCAYVTARSVAVYRTDNRTPNTLITGQVTRLDPQPTQPATVSEGDWRINVQDNLQFRPSATATLFRFSKQNVTILCRRLTNQTDASDIPSDIGLIVNGRLVQVDVPTAIGPPPNPPNYPNPGPEVVTVSNLLKQRSCAFVDATTLTLVSLGAPRQPSVQSTAIGTYKAIQFGQ